MKTLAAILAGGSGSRFAGNQPKQFVLLGGKPVLCHSVDVFERSDRIDAFLIISHTDGIDHIRFLAEQYGWKKFCGVLPGGATRSGSSQAALAYAAANGFDRLLIHDAARPLINEAMLDRLCDGLEVYDAVVAAVPVTDTISVSADGKTVTETPKRESLWSIQTPQGFSVPVLQHAYRLFNEDTGAVATDDGGVVRRYLPNIPVGLILGSRRAAKLTYPEDLSILETLLSE